MRPMRAVAVAMSLAAVGGLIVLIGSQPFAVSWPPTGATADGTASESTPSSLRKFAFTYRAKVRPISPRGRRLDVWIPLPRRDASQRISRIEVETPLKYETRSLRRFGNQVVHLFADGPLPETAEITLSFQVTRREQSADLLAAAARSGGTDHGTLDPFLRSNRLVPIGGRIAEVSRKIGNPHGSSALEQARAIYDYVTSVMRYDKSGSGWGRGDALYACDIHRGNCTDFHSLFIALARSRGIPARFVIGFPLEGARAAVIGGYHCWAEFRAGGQWIPVDASEAWKHPARHDYYFGHLDADRVAFTMGRDLMLEPPQHGPPLNYLIYPYAEEDGVRLPAASVKASFEYRNLPG